MKEKIKVAFQGAKGAYSHLACLEVFPKAEVTCCSTFEEAFQLAKDNSEFKIIFINNFSTLSNSLSMTSDTFNVFYFCAFNAQ